MKITVNNYKAVTLIEQSDKKCITEVESKSSFVENYLLVRVKVTRRLLKSHPVDKVKGYPLDQNSYFNC